jgi:hypothetical protein
LGRRLGYAPDPVSTLWRRERSLTLLRNEPRFLGLRALIRRREPKWGGSKNEKWTEKSSEWASEGRRDEEEIGKEEYEGEEMEE